MTGGRADRANRLRNFLSGPCASSSQDYVRLTNLLFEQSASYASATDGNCSVYALAGVPILFSALRALLIECNYGMYGAGRNEERLEVLSKSANEILFLAKNYKIPITLQQRLEILYEVRNEIIHPTHHRETAWQAGERPCMVRRGKRKNSGLLNQYLAASANLKDSHVQSK